MRTPSLALAAAIILGGCATVSSPPQILVETRSLGAPVSGAQCRVSTGQGQWLVTTPGSVAVGRPAGDLRVDCSRPGLRDTTLITPPVPFYYSPYYDPWFGRSSFYMGYGWGSRSGLGASFPIGYQQPDRWEYPARVVIEMSPSAHDARP